MNNLANISKELRIKIVDMIYKAGSGHLGGSLSIIDILNVIYNKHLDLNNDKVILSKGHAAPALYAILNYIGYIQDEELDNLRNLGGSLQGHPTNKIKGIDVSTGSLGQGLSVSSGIALAKKLDNDFSKVYCILGDGECEEGQIWEAFMTISKYNLNNLITIIDNNNLQIDGSIEEVKGLKNLKLKIASFGINIIECNGHDFKDIDRSIEEANKSNLPVCIIANTIKGKGISFMEDKVEWHGKSLKEEEYNKAIIELTNKEEVL